MSFSNCSCGGCGCGVCQPANVIYRSQCTDPGSVASLNHLGGYDAQFCPKRLLPGEGGFLFAQQNSSGSWVIKFSASPVITLGSLTAVLGQTFGKVVVNGSDNIQRQLTGPSTAGLILTTNASGDLVFAVLPTQNTPDPLTVNTINAANFTFGSGTFTGIPIFTGLATTAIVSTLGLDASNNLVKGTPATTGVQSVMFFEAPTSPSNTTPNAAVTAGGMLTIGNEISSSLAAGALISVTNSQTLTVVTAGFYNLDYCGGIISNANAAMTPSIQLLLNGVNVNNGNSRIGVAGTPNRTALTCTGFDARRLPVGTTIQLQMALGSGVNISAYEIRLRATRIGA